MGGPQGRSQFVALVDTLLHIFSIKMKDNTRHLTICAAQTIFLGRSSS